MIVCRNPVLNGFYPDPSICRVGDTYYMVNSTFVYFPGVPVFQSKNLAEWAQIGHVLERPSQMPVEGLLHSQGIYAPTIRYHNGTYYMITTNVPEKGNFIVTASQPEGPWSEPFYLGENAQGIDPSLFFDEDGTCYYIGQRTKKDSKYFGDCEIWIQRLNTETMELEGKAHAVLDGFQKHAVWPEGPHLYKKDGYYYILHAEGGTGSNHCIVAARSRQVFGPYEYAATNPILTHRHFGKNYPVTCVGHGDLVEDGHGNWYMVMLACRPQRGHTLLGRETFLAKVEWEEDWPVVNPGVGRLEETILLEEKQGGCQVSKEGVGKSCVRYLFTEKGLPKQFVMLRNPKQDLHSLEERPGYLRIRMTKASLRESDTCGYVAVRQQHHGYEAETLVEPHFASEKDCAGMAILQNEENQIRMELCQKEGHMGVRVVSCEQGNDRILGEQVLGKMPWEMCEGIRLKVIVYELKADFLWQRDDTWHMAAQDVDLTFLSTEAAGGFTGCTIGMYTSGNGRQSEGYADFAWFTYEGMEEAEAFDEKRDKK